MERIKKYTIFFSIGGIGYAIMELLWRGRTHWSMIIAGGICFICFSVISEAFKKAPLLFKAILCACCVTLVELVFGIIFNLILKMNVWNYSAIPLNFLGQICPLFSLFWGLTGLSLMPLTDALNKKLVSNHEL